MAEGRFARARSRSTGRRGAAAAVSEGASGGRGGAPCGEVGQRALSQPAAYDSQRRPEPGLQCGEEDDPCGQRANPPNVDVELRRDAFCRGRRKDCERLFELVGAEPWAERVERLLLVGPAGLPLTKPIAGSLHDFWKQVTAGVYSPAQLARAVGEALVAPRKAYRLACVVRSLDLTEQFNEIRRQALPCSVVACAGDTLTPVQHCREVARLAGARYQELDAAGGHMWMLADPAAFAAVSD